MVTRRRMAQLAIPAMLSAAALTHVAAAAQIRKARNHSRAANAALARGNYSAYDNHLKKKRSIKQGWVGTYTGIRRTARNSAKRLVARRRCQFEEWLWELSNDRERSIRPECMQFLK